MNRISILRRSTSRAAQRGVSLLFALMALVILGFGAVALTRSVDTGTLILGNLAFKQDTIAASSRATEEALVWLAANAGGNTLNGNLAASGYYASSIDTLDPTGNHNRNEDGKRLPQVNWDGACNGLALGTYGTCDTLPFTGTTVNGNKVQWVITRLCDSTGAPTATNRCVRPAAASTSTALDRGELNPGGRISTGIAGPYYRVIVRVEGPRNTVSYTESLVHF
jgi:hypothetical protein